jgi:dTDP-4-dehydrorhamnose reductase
MCRLWRKLAWAKIGQKRIEASSKPFDETQYMKLLITGGSGFFGMNAARWFREHGHTTTLTSSAPERYAEHNAPVEPIVPMNICDAEAVKRSLDGICSIAKPDAIIHAAAFSQPLACEQDPERARLVNVQGTANILQAASNLAIPLIFLSSDLVFDGIRTNAHFYTERDEPNARIVYGQTKIAAERVIAEYASAQWIIVRSALMFGLATPWSNGFPQFAIEALRQGKQTTLFTDQFRTPIWIDDLARALESLLLCLLAGERVPAIVHAGGAERISRVDFVRRYCEQAGIATNGIRAVPMDAVPEYTTRVHDVALDSSTLAQTIDWLPTPLGEAFAAMLERK